jgi:hypothetical protein
VTHAVRRNASGIRWDGIATSPNGHKMAWLKDPEGNIISIGDNVG